MEPSCGDAVFLAAAAETRPDGQPFVGDLVGYDLHADSVADGLRTLASAGVVADLRVADFFDVEPDPSYSAVVGNPPYIRFQGFGGASRAASLRRAAAAEVSISGLASSWAAFVVHASTFLELGGRMGLVLPAELLSVNYAASIRRYLLASFASIELVLFEELVFAGVQADVVVSGGRVSRRAERPLCSLSDEEHRDNRVALRLSLAPNSTDREVDRSSGRSRGGYGFARRAAEWPFGALELVGEHHLGNGHRGKQFLLHQPSRGSGTRTKPGRFDQDPSVGIVT